MVKNLIIYIFIYTLLVGCDVERIIGVEDCTTFLGYDYLEVSAPSLQMDDNGYYHMEWLEGYTQTFSTLNADTQANENEILKVTWSSDSGIYYTNNWVSSVNPASYTGSDGVAHTVLGVWEEQIGDTITVYAQLLNFTGYFSEDCHEEYMDSIKVVVDNEIQN